MLELLLYSLAAHALSTKPRSKPRTHKEWEDECLKALHALIYGEGVGWETETTDARLYAREEEDMGEGFNKGQITAALNRLEGKGLVVKTRVNPPPRPKPNSGLASILHVSTKPHNVFFLTSAGRTAARVASGLAPRPFPFLPLLLAPLVSPSPARPLYAFSFDTLLCLRFIPTSAS